MDESSQYGPQYAVAEAEDGTVVGVAGYERYGDASLLRSGAVAEERRSAGIGARLAADRLEHARRSGCATAFLLTDTAKEYWLKLGFEVTERAAAPAGIAQSLEWSHACPASSTAMRRALLAGAGAQ
ncbi:MAG: GNAT family N-acetyltransferase [Acidobacteria bacterium]|nr:GNAT family N-acetyltransferase [Acidobacteriota bacterium]